MYSWALNYYINQWPVTKSKFYKKITNKMETKQAKTEEETKETTEKTDQTSE